MVTIKNMEMPKSCKECKDKRIDHITFELCLRTGRNVVDCKNHRHCDCPLVEIEERKTGKWIDCWGDKTEPDGETWWSGCKCSECSGYFTQHFNYCPNCGIKMENGENV